MDTISDERPVARKPHRCEMCSRRIDPGEQYHRQFIVDAGEAWTWKTCAHCEVFIDVIWDALSEYCNMWDEGIGQDSAADFEPSNLYEARLKVYWRNGWRRRDGSLRPVPQKPAKQAAA